MDQRETERHLLLSHAAKFSKRDKVEEGSGIDLSMMCEVTLSLGDSSVEEEKRCHCALSSASLCLIPAHHVPPIVFLSLFFLSPLSYVHIGVNHLFLSVVFVQLSESTTTLCSLPPITLPMCIPMTLPTLTFLQQQVRINHFCSLKFIRASPTALCCSVYHTPNYGRPEHFALFSLFRAAQDEEFLALKLFFSVHCLHAHDSNSHCQLQSNQNCIVLIHLSHMFYAFVLERRKL